ncbi:MAG: pyridoxal phosphate-dependent aminotransferase [Acidobacteriota bacterium]
MIASSAPPVLSRRANRLAESATMRVSRRAAELREAGRSIINFGAGEPDFDSPAVAVEAARQALADGFTRYTPAPGMPALRDALAADARARHGAPWQRANCLVTVGGKAALFELAMTLIDEGDEAIVPVPAWVSFLEQIRFAGGTPVTVSLAADDAFAVHAAPIIDALTPRTRMVVLNAPSNPTGGLMAADELRAIVEACAARGVVVVCDETYERFVYDNATCASGAALAAEFPETIVVVGSFSKTYAMTGWRVGFALGAETLIAKLGAVQSHMTSNPTSFAMAGALAALDGAESDVRTMLATFARRRDLVVERLDAMPGVTCAPPQGAFYVFPDVSAHYQPGRADSVAMAEFLLEQAGVAVVPGVAFGNDRHIRISFACSAQELETGLDRIAVALRGA